MTLAIFSAKIAEIFIIPTDLFLFEHNYLSIIQTTTIYKATQKGKGQSFVNRGFHADDFPYHPPNADGKCYFSAPDSRRLAEEYHRYYKDGILEVTIDSEIYDQYFKPLERSYQGTEQVEFPMTYFLS